ncbi:phage tail tape measure protein [Variovorax sp. GT1P44]|uniref:phage tail tape measure protein n=1 Tax=Variovorax sp. GT1P44 TaxID=3443742 RepID=UPI003F455C10
MEFTADASGVKAGVDQAKRSLADLGAAAVSEGKKAADGLAGIGKGGEVAASKVEATTKNLQASLQRYIASLETGKKTGADFIESVARQRGANVDALKPLIDQARQLEAQIKKTTAATIDFSKVTTSLGASNTLAGATTSLGATNFEKPSASVPIPAIPVPVIPPAAIAGVETYTKSVKQLAMQHQIAAVQVKDFFEQVVSGGSPLRAFALQGAAVVSNYGGVGNTFRALTSLITPMRVAIGGAVAVVSALAVAMHEGAQESTAYAKALILTGNSIGKTTDQLREQAAIIAKTTGTQGDAAEALAALAQSGKIAAGSMGDVGAAVVSMNRVLGTSVDKAVDVFEKLADEPAKASAKLNEQMHYLNLTTYERIRALEEQGDKEAAAALAQTTYANATTTRLGQVEQQAGVLVKAWRALAHDAKDAWDMMMGLGRPQTPGEALAAAQKSLDEKRSRGPLNSLTSDSYEKGLAAAQQKVTDLSRKALREQENADAEGQRARDQSAKISASDRIKTLSDEVRTNADKRKKALADLDRDFKTLGKSTSGPEYDKLVANINDKFKDPKGAQGKAFTDDAGTKMLENLRQQQASLKEQLETDDKLTDSEKERAKFAQLIADLKTKGTLTADQKSLLASQASIKAQLDINVEIAKQVELKKAAAKLDEKAKRDAEEFARQVEGINISIASSNDSRKDQQDRALGAFGLGDRARQEVEAQRSIRKEYENYKKQLTKDAAEKNQLGSDAYKDEVAKIQAALDDALKSQQEYFDALKQKREDWTNGATTALANYIDYVNDAANRAQQLTGSLLSGVTDGVTGLLMGDKGSSWKDMGKKIYEQIARGIVEQQITKPFAQLLQGQLGDKDSILSKVFGGLTSNKETGESWLGALGLGGKSGGDGAAAASTASLATSAAGATASISALAAAAAAAAAAMGGASISSALTVANGVGASGGDALGSLIKGMGWSEGGYTGEGSKMQPAGIVHAGEYVINAENTKKLGTGFLDRLNRRGYANGGYVGAIAGGNLQATNAPAQGGGNTYITVPVTGQVDRRTREQIASDISIQQRNARRFA